MEWNAQRRRTPSFAFSSAKTGSHLSNIKIAGFRNSRRRRRQSKSEKNMQIITWKNQSQIATIHERRPICIECQKELENQKKAQQLAIKCSIPICVGRVFACLCAICCARECVCVCVDTAMFIYKLRS